MRGSDRPHWSYSAISQYLRCPLQYYFKPILKLSEPTLSSGLLLGSCVHEALAVYHRSLQKGILPTVELVHQAFRNHWDDREQRSPIEFKANETRDRLIEQGLALLDLYLREPPPENIVAVEQRLLIPLHTSEGEYLETPLVAIADLVVRESTGLKVNEFKTSGRNYGEFEVHNSLQATCYVNALWECSGELAGVEYAVLVKTKTPKLQRISTTRTEEDLGRLGDLVETIERAVQRNIFYPVENPLNCSTCPYRSECREWKPERGREILDRSGIEERGVFSC
ncbi:MAG TPA: PD-(D/E)XK nuclease family protein [Planctomicrobium sp.]|nr:PD-(D/E)XK nuclease family protein [Planctomicrobium sp.]